MVDQSAATQTLSFTNTVATAHGDPNYCGAITYTLTPYSFLSLSNGVITLSTMDPTQEGMYAPSLTANLLNWQISSSTSFTATIGCSTLTNTFDASTPTSMTFDDKNMTQPITFSYATDVTPQCMGTYYTVNVSVDPDPGFTITYNTNPTNPNGMIYIDGVNKKEKGSYTITITSTASAGGA